MEYRAYLFEEIEPEGIICNRGRLIDTAQIIGDGRRKPERWKEVAKRIFFEERDWINKEEYFIKLEKVSE